MDYDQYLAQNHLNNMHIVNKNLYNPNKEPVGTFPWELKCFQCLFATILTQRKKVMIKNVLKKYSFEEINPSSDVFSNI